MIYCWLRNNTFDNDTLMIFRSNATIAQFKHDIRGLQYALNDIQEDRIRLYRIPGDENAVRESLTKTGSGEPFHGRTLEPIFLGVPVLNPLYVVVEVILAGKPHLAISLLPS